MKDFEQYLAETAKQTEHADVLTEGRRLGNYVSKAFLKEVENKGEAVLKLKFVEFTDDAIETMVAKHKGELVMLLFEDGEIEPCEVTQWGLDEDDSRDLIGYAYLPNVQ